MIRATEFTEMALSFPGVEPKVHFDRTGFAIRGKKMFASYLPRNNTANIFLTVAEQSIFCEMDNKNICPVPNKWGEKGATTFELNHVPAGIVLEALLSAYNEVMAGKK